MFSSFSGHRRAESQFLFMPKMLSSAVAETGTRRVPEFVELVIGLHRREQGGGIAAGLLPIPAQGIRRSTRTCASESPCKTRTSGIMAR